MYDGVAVPQKRLERLEQERRHILERVLAQLAERGGGIVSLDDRRPDHRVVQMRQIALKPGHSASKPAERADRQAAQKVAVFGDRVEEVADLCEPRLIAPGRPSRQFEEPQNKSLERRPLVAPLDCGQGIILVERRGLERLDPVRQQEWRAQQRVDFDPRDVIKAAVGIAKHRSGGLRNLVIEWLCGDPDHASKRDAHPL